ncbi:helix-turn-helix domain protein [Denitrovibrio acetiphilus DSM 12809]|uniref:Helix-turn-helix domain protein n=2 Tax=Denitrovibrio TaxID=117999 RepID=D4H430_DENA2|nr:helix-turn-helix domain protein [Denitrovibrio acetiphilus DSM 12809]
MTFITLEEMAEYIRNSLRNTRLEKNLTQEGLAERSGVSLGTLKKFESTGQISLESLLKLCLALNLLDNFANLFDKQEQLKSLDAILSQDKTRKRGRKK